jgi:hypothetical protein
VGGSPERARRKKTSTVFGFGMAKKEKKRSRSIEWAFLDFHIEQDKINDRYDTFLFLI